MPATINLEDIDPKQRKELGIRKSRETAFSKDELRGWALKVLALIANLSRSERERILRHALKADLTVSPVVASMMHSSGNDYWRAARGARCGTTIPSPSMASDHLVGLRDPLLEDRGQEVGKENRKSAFSNPAL